MMTKLLPILVISLVLFGACTSPSPVPPPPSESQEPLAPTSPTREETPATTPQEAPATPSPSPGVTSKPTPTPFSPPPTSSSLLSRIKLAPGYKIEAVYQAPLSSPNGIAIAPNGNLTIMENDTHVLKSVTLDGKVSLIREILSAVTVVYDSAGNLFVGGGGGIWKIPPQGEISRFSDVSVSKMAFSPDGFLYAVNWARSSPDIIKISPDGKASVFFSGLSRAFDITFSPQGEMYVAEPGAQRIIRIDRDGKTATIVQGLWTDPIAIDFDKNGVLYFTSGWVGKEAEYGLYKVSLPDGSVKPIVLEPGIKGSISDLAVSDDGNLFLVSVTFGTLYNVTPNGNVTALVEAWHNARGMTIGPNGNIFIADPSRFPNPGRVLQVDLKGNVSTVADGFKHPKYLTFDTSENLLVSDLYGGGIIRLNSKGERQMVFPPPDHQSIAYDPISGDIFAYSVGKDEIIRINASGNATRIPFDFGGDVNDGRLAFDRQGNLFIAVVYTNNIGVGPILTKLFKMATDGTVKLMASFSDRVPTADGPLAVSPEGDAYMIGHPDYSFEMRKISPQGEVSIIASRLPIDPFGIAINASGDIFFSASPGIFRIFRVD